MPCFIQQTALVMLGMHLNQQISHRPQQADTDWLIIDKGAGLPILGLNPAQNHTFFNIDFILGQELKSSMTRRQFKNGRHTPLGRTLRDQPSVCTTTNRKPQRIKKNRFSCPGLARQGAQAFPKVQIQFVDKDNVSDRQRCQH